MAPTAGLVIINTGEGKGKTTAALGVAVRAAGLGKKVLIRQFIKGGWVPGEVKAAPAFGNLWDWKALGDGFLKADASEEEKAQHRADTRAAFAAVREEIRTTDAAVVILDEILYCVKYGLVDEAEVLACIAEKRADLHLILTGRGATPGLIAAADLVTEMHAIKHPYKKGIPAQPGIEF